MRRVTGLPVGGDRQGAQQWQQQQQQSAARMAQLQEQAVAVKLAGEQAKTLQTAAQTQKLATDAVVNIAQVASADGSIAANEEAMIQEALQEALSG